MILSENGERCRFDHRRAATSIRSHRATLLNEMVVFISWSGERSKKAAEALREWLPKVINAVKPWLSATDIDRGSRWGVDVAGRLEQARMGIICLTPGNLHADWILFEAGALSKTLQTTLVCPLLFGLQPADVRGPLAQFQATRTTKEEMRQLLKTINTALGEQSLTDAHLADAFDVWWPKLEEQFAKLPPEGEHESPVRSERDILEEILALVRSGEREKAERRGTHGAGAVEFTPREPSTAVMVALGGVWKKFFNTFSPPASSRVESTPEGILISLRIPMRAGANADFAIPVKLPKGPVPPEILEDIIWETLRKNYQPLYEKIRAES